MYFADVSPDEPLGETDCCGFNVFNVYSVAVQIEIYIILWLFDALVKCMYHTQNSK